MKKSVIQIFIFFYSICSYSVHKDQVFVYKFGNIKTRVQTSFNGYGLTEKVKISGQLAQKLSERLFYKDTIIIEFCHDYTNIFPRVLIAENGNSSTEFLICGELEKVKENQEKSYFKKYGQNAICIRLLDTDFSIEKTLKLIEFCILNKFENKLNDLKYKNINGYPINEVIKEEYYGLENKLIKKILNQKNSKNLNDILKNKIQFFNFFDVTGFYENGVFSFKSNNISYQTKTLLYLVEMDNGISIFPSNNLFVYLGKKTNDLKKHKIKIIGDDPYLTSHLNYFEKVKLIENGNLMLYKFNTLKSVKGVIFSEEKNEIIKIIN